MRWCLQKYNRNKKVVFALKFSGIVLKKERIMALNGKETKV